MVDYRLSWVWLVGYSFYPFYNVVAAWAFGYFIDILFGTFSVGGEAFGAFTKDWVKPWVVTAIIFMVTTAFIVSSGVFAGGIERAARILMPTLFIMILRFNHLCHDVT